MFVAAAAAAHPAVDNFIMHTSTLLHSLPRAHLYFTQVNKNVYLKGRLGADGVALMAAFKSWFQPSLTLAGVVERSFETGKTRTGMTVQVGFCGVVCCSWGLVLVLCFGLLGWMCCGVAGMRVCCQHFQVRACEFCCGVSL